jgi:hypothetical protein
LVVGVFGLVLLYFAGGLLDEFLFVLFLFAELLVSEVELIELRFLIGHHSFLLMLEFGNGVVEFVEFPFCFLELSDFAGQLIVEFALLFLLLVQLEHDTFIDVALFVFDELVQLFFLPLDFRFGGDFFRLEGLKLRLLCFFVLSIPFVLQLFLLLLEGLEGRFHYC